MGCFLNYFLGVWFRDLDSGPVQIGPDTHYTALKCVALAVLWDRHRRNRNILSSGTGTGAGFGSGPILNEIE
jgi:hypothetical protein